MPTVWSEGSDTTLSTTITPTTRFFLSKTVRSMRRYRMASTAMSRRTYSGAGTIPAFPFEYKCAPLRDKAGNIYGVTVVFRDISERKKAEQHIIYLTQHCPLTDLPNRILFGDRLKQAIRNAKRSRTKFGLLFVDIDGFKPVNDRYGHAVGDMLLQRIGKRMKHCIRESDTVARIGGDEFVAILPVVNEAEDAIS